MPIFEYRCGDCGQNFEKLVRREADVIACPACDGRHLEQQLSTFAAKADGPKEFCGGPTCQMGTCGSKN